MFNRCWKYSTGLSNTLIIFWRCLVVNECPVFLIHCGSIHTFQETIISLALSCTTLFFTAEDRVELKGEKGEKEAEKSL